jgi:phosphatidylserine decarboxylase
MNMTLHREGPPVILITFLLVDLVVGGVLWLTWGTPWVWLAVFLGALGLVLIGLVINFFRSPIFTVTPDDRAIIAPANGKVVVIEEVDEPVYFKKRMLQISIFMSPLDVHINRTPVRGRIVWQRYFPGKFLVAWHPKSSTDNEQTFLVMDSPIGQVGFKQIAGALARRILYYTQEGQELQQGEEFGFIRFGSRVDILLPIGANVCVSLGERTKGGRTVIARYS